MEKKNAALLTALLFSPTYSVSSLFFKNPCGLTKKKKKNAPLLGAQLFPIILGRKKKFKNSLCEGKISTFTHVGNM